MEKKRRTLLSDLALKMMKIEKTLHIERLSINKKRQEVKKVGIF